MQHPDQNSTIGDSRALERAHEFLRRAGPEAEARLASELACIEDPALRAEVELQALIGLALERLAADEELVLGEFLARASSDAQRSRLRAEIVAGEFLFRLDRGETVEPEAYVARLECDAERARFHGALQDAQLAALRLPWRLDEGVVLRERYVIGAQLGRGGMGVVHRAWDRDLEREVAVKALRIDPMSATPGLAQSLVDESRTLAQLESEHIVTVHDVVREGSCVYVVLDLVDGTDLDTVVERVRCAAAGRPSQRLTALLSILGAPAGSDLDRSARRQGWYRFLAGIVARLARALEQAHAAETLHRDIKPQNIRVRSDGVPVLLDFGLAHRFGGTPRDEGGRLRGTLEYLAPEQIERKETGADPRTDVYQIGIVLYELIALERAIPRRTDELMHDAFERVRQGPVALRSLDPRVPSVLAAITAKAIAGDPERRYQAMGELREDLERFLDRKPPRHAELGARAAAGAWMRYAASRPAVRALAAVLVLLVVGQLVRDAVTWNAPEFSAVFLVADGAHAPTLLLPDMEVGPDQTLGVTLESDDRCYLYALSLFGGETQNRRYVSPSEPELLGAAEASSSHCLEVPPGRHPVACVVTEAGNEYEGFLLYACKEKDAVIEAWLDQLEAVHEEAAALPGVPYETAMALLDSSALGKRGRSPGSLSKEERSLRYDGLADLESSDDVPGIRRYWRVFRQVGEQ